MTNNRYFLKVVCFLTKNKYFFLNLSIAILSLITFLKIFDEFYRLIFVDSHIGGIDLKMLKRAMYLWFENDPNLYGNFKYAHYPPATYVVLWPVIGWMKFEFARIVWAILMIPSILLTSYYFYINSNASGNEEKIISYILPLSLNAVGVTIGNGQLTLFVLIAILFSITILKDKEISHKKGFLVSILIVISVLKPSVTLPFLWIVLFVYPMPRVILTSILIYTILTFFAFYFREIQEVDVVSVAITTYESVDQAISAGSKGGGYANLHSLLIYFGLDQWNIISTLLLGLLYGFWVYRNKQSDLWILIAITAIFSRFWMYHRVYDDMLIFIPMITLFRLVISQKISKSLNQVSLLFLIITVLSMILPARLQYMDILKHIFTIGHTAVWIALICYLLYLNEKKIPT